MQRLLACSSAMIVTLIFAIGCEQQKGRIKPDGQSVGLNAAEIGSPAIRPHLKATPSFTLDEARSYVATHPFPGNSHPSAIAVVSAQFVTSRTAAALAGGEPTGLVDTSLVCFVEVRGELRFLGPPGVELTYRAGYEVF